jgi:hypothetical protein
MQSSSNKAGMTDSKTKMHEMCMKHMKEMTKKEEQISETSEHSKNIIKKHVHHHGTEPAK